MQHLLPRHMQIIYDINLFFLQSVEKKFPKDRDLLAKVSVIEESQPQSIRMAHLAIVGSHKVNGVAELHSDLIQATIFKDFVTVFGKDKFINITNGITPRRWLHQANPLLADLIAEKLDGYAFLKDLTLLEGLTEHVHDKEFRKQWMDIKYANKVRLAKFINQTTKIAVNPSSLFDIQVKRIHEYKRQQMNIFGVISRYLKLKAMKPAERKKVVPRVSIFGGKAAPGYWMAKTIIRLVTAVSDVLNNDKEIGDLLKVVFIEDYNVSKAEIIIPASDISEHISTAGTEASGTSNMKFALNGGLIIGTVDGANVEIAEKIGDEQAFTFGHLAPVVPELRHQHHFGKPKPTLDPCLKTVFDEIRKGTFGSEDLFEPLMYSIEDGGDYYLVSDDFGSYLNAQALVDELYVDKDAWAECSILSVAKMGHFSSDRTIVEYAESVWSIEPVPVSPVSKKHTSRLRRVVIG